MVTTGKDASGRVWRRVVHRLLLGCLGAWLVLPALSLAQEGIDEIRRVPAASWVVPVERGEVDEALLGQISNGTYYLLSDAQILADKERSIYRRFASKAINTAGVDSLATIEISFDPAYQRLDLNAIDLIRDGRTISRLDSATLRVLQRETELERRIFDGRKSVTIFLEDVRVGDIVDYAYTVRGRNEVFDGREFGLIGLQFNVPVARIHGRLLSPRARDLKFAQRNTAIEPAVRVQGDLRVHEWNLEHVAALNPDPDAPVWYDPYPVVQWSELSEWPAVRHWARPLYAIPGTSSPELEAEIQRIAKSDSSPEGRLLAALRFVQGEIRYLGVEIGAGSHAPSTPDQVLARRFGDCKDKTLLMLTLLDRLGIEAYPALVDTASRRALATRLPSPIEFDHVIVQAKVGKRTLWLDPTRPTQNADLDHLVQPDYDLALVVDGSRDGLVSMKEGRTPSPARLVKATFDGRDGLDKPVPFTVQTTVEGERAEGLRNALATSNFEELQKDYLNFYAEYFSGLEIATPMQVLDDELNNRIVTTERYRIPAFSSWSKEGRRFVAAIWTPDLDEKLRNPQSTVRNSPLGILRNNDLTLITETLLPEPWDIKPDRIKVEDPAFTFERTVTYKENRLVLNDRFQSLVDEVAAAETTRYANNLSKARDQTNFQLYWNDPSGPGGYNVLDRINWTLVLIAIMILAFWVWFARTMYRYDPPARPRSRGGLPQGLGGWLVIPGIGLIGTPIVALQTLVSDIGAWSADNWARLTTFSGPDYHALWAPTLLFELVTQLGVVVFGILLVILYFKRRSSVPALFIGLQIAAAAQLLIDQALIRALPQDVAEADSPGKLLAAFVPRAIWIAYFLLSVRVGNTFVVRHKAPSEPQPAVPREAFSL